MQFVRAMKDACHYYNSVTDSEDVKPRIRSYSHRGGRGYRNKYVERAFGCQEVFA